jgi:periplasmic divalent cation tolerance protein
MIRIVETTTDQVKIAEKISTSIINLKLSPCVQIVDKVRTFYIWKDEMVSSEEYVIKIKTIEKNIEKISSIIIKESNYDIPEVISYGFEIESKDYEDWFNENI